MSTQYALFLVSHSDIRTRPDRAERALRVFFPRLATDYFASMRRGEHILVREGDLDSLSAFASSLSAQGFMPSVRTLE